MHLKGLAMAPCKLPCAVFIRRLKDSQLNKLSNDLYSNMFYGKELTFHEAIDPSVCFKQHASSVGLKQHRLFLDHVIFIYNYLESACHDEQNGDQSFKLQARIVELCQFKA